MYRYVKRILDLLFAVVGGVVFLPFGLLIAALIKLDSKGPALFRQERVGKDCRVFKIYKFRTMKMEAVQDGQPLSDMERMTRVGNVLRKFSLDEMPQIINIIKGEMSFIGPRPLLVEYIPRYTTQQMRRHEVLPGITGWAQVNGRNAVEWEKKFEHDVWYVEHISLRTDIRILLRTIKVIFMRTGINSSRDSTMPVFMGTEDMQNGG